MKISCDTCKKLSNAVLSGIAKNCKMYEEKSA